MSSDRDVTRIVRSWLDEGVTALPDRVLDAVLDQVPATPQRRATWWPARRFGDMNTYAKLAIAAAAVVVVAIIGINLLPAGGGRGGDPTVSPSPSPSPSPTPQPSPSPAPAAAFPPAGELAIGRHSVTVDGVSFSFELTAGGWFSNPSDSGGYIQLGADNETTPAWMIFWNPDNVYADPCAHTLLDPAVGPSAGALAAALLTIPGTDATGPTIVTVNRSPDDPERRLFDARYVELTVHEDVGCAAEDFYLWEEEGVGPRYASLLPTTIRVWIIDVDGARIFIESEVLEATTPDLDQVIAQIVDSIQFE